MSNPQQRLSISCRYRQHASTVQSNSVVECTLRMPGRPHICSFSTERFSRHSCEVQAQEFSCSGRIGAPHLNLYVHWQDCLFIILRWRSCKSDKAHVLQHHDSEKLRSPCQFIATCPATSLRFLHCTFMHRNGGLEAGRSYSALQSQDEMDRTILVFRSQTIFLAASGHVLGGW